MIAVRYLGDGEYGDLIEGREYEVIAISLPTPKMPFFRVVDESGEDYLYPFSFFEILFGKELFDAFLEDEASREETIEQIIQATGLPDPSDGLDIEDLALNGVYCVPSDDDLPPYPIKQLAQWVKERGKLLDEFDDEDFDAIGVRW